MLCGSQGWKTYSPALCRSVRHPLANQTYEWCGLLSLQCHFLMTDVSFLHLWPCPPPSSRTLHLYISPSGSWGSCTLVFPKRPRCGCSGSTLLMCLETLRSGDRWHHFLVCTFCLWALRCPSDGRRTLYFPSSDTSTHPSTPFCLLCEKPLCLSPLPHSHPCLINACLFFILQVKLVSPLSLFSQYFPVFYI